MSWFHTHAHSEFSCLDGMADIDAMVAKAAAMGQPAVGLTDHGNMAGSFALYKAARTHDLKAFPGPGDPGSARPEPGWRWRPETAR